MFLVVYTAVKVTGFYIDQHLLWKVQLVKLFQFRLLQLEKFIFREHTEMCWGIDQFFKNKYCKYRGIKSLSQHFKKEICHYVNITWLFLTGKLVLESLFNSEYCKIFKSTYFEEHLRTAASENVFMKLRNIKIYHKKA